MADTQIDGAHLWFPAEIDIAETIPFIDRRDLGVITLRPQTGFYYASLMCKSLPDEGMYAHPTWTAHTLCEAITDSLADARSIVMAAYEALNDRLATNE